MGISVTQTILVTFSKTIRNTVIMNGQISGQCCRNGFINVLFLCKKKKKNVSINHHTFGKRASSQASRIRIRCCEGKYCLFLTTETAFQAN